MTTQTPAHGCRIHPLPVAMPAGSEGAGPQARPVNILGTLAHTPNVMQHVTACGGALFQDTLISPRDREIVILRVGWRCQSIYEYGQHTLFGRAAGLTDDEIGRLAGGPGSWPRADAALVTMADELCEGNDVTEPTWAELRERFSARQLVELLLIAGYYWMMSGLLNAAGVELESWTPSWPDRQ